MCLFYIWMYIRYPLYVYGQFFFFHTPRHLIVLIKGMFFWQKLKVCLKRNNKYIVSSNLKMGNSDFSPWICND